MLSDESLETAGLQRKVMNLRREGDWAWMGKGMACQRASPLTLLSGVLAVMVGSSVPSVFHGVRGNIESSRNDADSFGKGVAEESACENVGLGESLPVPLALSVHL